MKRLAAIVTFLVVVPSVGMVQAENRCPLGAQGAAVAKKISDKILARRTLKRLLTLDRDHDGLPDCLESQLGFSAAIADTNHNGVPDGDEAVSGASTALDLYSQGQLDSDGDGLSDLEEKAVTKTSPYLADSNGNGILDGKEAVAVAGAVVLRSEHESEVEDDDDGDDDVRPTPPPRKRVTCSKSTRKAARTSRVARKGTSLKSTSAKKKKCRPAPRRTPAPGASPTPRPTAAPGGGGSVSPTPAPAPSTGNAQDGKAFYSQYCTSCHGKWGGSAYSTPAKAEARVRTMIAGVSNHAGVRGILKSGTGGKTSAQLYANIAAYLASSL